MNDGQGINKHGLSRGIPQDVKRLVRQKCGFGCVICGKAIYQYEHVDPPFAEATEHDPARIVLLCPGCHGKVTTGMLSKETVKKAGDTPMCRQQGFSFEAFDIGAGLPVVEVPGLRCIDTPVLLEVCGTPLISFARPESAGGPFRLSALFYDNSGNELLRIENNEWRSIVSAWDFEVKGRRITCRIGPGKIALVLRSEPPTTLVVERLDMCFMGTAILLEEGRELSITGPTGASITLGSGATVTLERRQAGIVIDDKGDLFVSHP